MSCCTCGYRLDGLRAQREEGGTWSVLCPECGTRQVLASRETKRPSHRWLIDVLVGFACVGLPCAMMFGAAVFHTTDVLSGQNDVQEALWAASWAVGMLSMPLLALTLLRRVRMPWPLRLIAGVWPGVVAAIVMLVVTYIIGIGVREVLFNLFG